MLALASVTCLVTGGGLAFAATKRLRHAVALERLAGVLMIVGLALLGIGLKGIQL